MDTIDYTEVMDVIVDVVTTQSYSLLERLAQMSAEAIMRKFPVDEVWVQVTKPHPPVAMALTSVAAAVELEQGRSGGLVLQQPGGGLRAVRCAGRRHPGRRCPRPRAYPGVPGLGLQPG